MHSVKQASASGARIDRPLGYGDEAGTPLLGTAPDPLALVIRSYYSTFVLLPSESAHASYGIRVIAMGYESKWQNRRDAPPSTLSS